MSTPYMYVREKKFLVLIYILDDSRVLNMESYAIKILNDIFDTAPNAITHFTNGYCHSVYYVEVGNDKYVLRITSKENEEYYHGSIAWLTKLSSLGIPVPEIIKHGQFEDVFYNLISFIDGKDLGDVYHTLTDFQKRDIAKDLTTIQKRVSTLPKANYFGYNSCSSWVGYLENLMKRSSERIKKNGLFDENMCTNLIPFMQGLNDYFSQVNPTPFLDDVTTKNLLIHNGKLSGIVDVDEICYGDSFLVVGLTNMALLSMEADTKYIDYWLDELKANDAQRKAVQFYTLLYCIDFMGEQGMCFNNNKEVLIDQIKIDLLNSIYNKLVFASGH